MTTAIVIPVRGDHQPLAQTLSAIRRSPETADLTVIVAVDGPDQALVKLAKEHDADVVELPEPRSSYAAREAAIDSLGPDVDVVVFTDAGCMPHDGWITAHRRALEAADLSGGAVVIPLGDRPTSAEVVDARRNLTQQAYVENDGFAATCNLAVRRDLLRTVRFDPSLESGGDRDFCHRAAAAGFRLVYTADAAITHEPRRTWRSVLTKAARVGRGIGTVPLSSQPPELPRPSFPLSIGRSHPRGAGIRGLRFAIAAATLEYLRVRAYVRAALRSGYEARPETASDVVVFLSSRWEAVQSTPTRWSRMVEGIAGESLARSVTVVSFPAMRRKYLARRGHDLARARSSWHPGTLAFDVLLPESPVPWVLDVVARWRVARVLDRSLPGTRRSRVVVVNHPLWAETALRVPARVHAFDTDDDWRARPGSERLAARADAGYRALRRFDAVTANSESWASTLAEDYGCRPAVVGNGVHVARYADEHAPAPAGLPDEPFAVYVGSLDYRIDHDLLDRVAGDGGVRVVVAGPATGATATRLRTSAVEWIGPVEPALVPGLLRRAAVGLLPHTVDAFTKSMDPMKLLEYLAAGLPVVSTPVPIAPDLQPDVVIAPDDASFAAAVRSAVEAPRRRPVPLAVADRDWRRVAARLLTEIERQAR